MARLALSDPVQVAELAQEHERADIAAGERYRRARLIALSATVLAVAAIVAWAGLHDSTAEP